MKSLENLVRDGVVTENHEGDMYKTVFVGRNFYVYRHVNKGIGYGGKNYKEEGYVLVWSSLQEVGGDMIMPSFVTK